MRSLALPQQFNFVDWGVYDFNKALSFFDWEIEKTDVTIDLRRCATANFTALSLLVLYAWHLTLRGCRVDFIYDTIRGAAGASGAWQKLGAQGLNHVLTRPTDNFWSATTKPLFAIRSYDDITKVTGKAADYTGKFNVEYKNLLSYVVSEILSNTLDHGSRSFYLHAKHYRFPSLLQYSWYQRQNELQFLVADLGIGVKKHLEHTYPLFPSHADALAYSVKPQVSGTFGTSDPYKAKNNAGMGLYLSSAILQRLRGDMHLVSGDGVLHISPADVTTSTIPSSWPGTLVHVVVRLGLDPAVQYQQLLGELKESARKEILDRDQEKQAETLALLLSNFLGRALENKAAAVRFRDERLLPALEAGQRLVLDFDEITVAPHSVLNALLATPIHRLGMQAYKRLRFRNVAPEIRETIDYILDENTKAASAPDDTPAV